jgi:hypothetical protein
MFSIGTKVGNGDFMLFTNQELNNFIEDKVSVKKAKVDLY